jgi:2-polyprenyl-3-methyl-5-hydroxy-6-metoxy-1,4-benzoquinol methylase
MTADPRQVRAYYDTDVYLAGNPMIPVRARLLSEILSDARGSHILDLGCGDGRVTRPLLRNGNRLTLVDFSRVMLDRAMAGFPPDAPVEFVEADVLSYRPREPVDAVVCVGVLAHVPSPGALLRHISGLVRPQGICVLEFMDGSAPMGRLLTGYSEWRRQEGWKTNRLTLSEVVELAAAHHLAVIPRTLRRYGLLVPGSGKLPYPVVAQIEQAAASHPRVSRLAAQALLGFRRVPH